MSARLRLAPALLVALLGVGLALHMSPSGAGSTVNPAPTSPVSAVGGVAITVADMDRSVAFYSTVLFFDKVSDVQTSGASIDRLLGVTGARVRIVTMRLGAERIPPTRGATIARSSTSRSSSTTSTRHTSGFGVIMSNRPRRSPSGCRTGIRPPVASARSPSRTLTATRSRFSSSPPGRAKPAGSGRAIASSSGSITRRWSWAIPRRA